MIQFISLLPLVIAYICLSCAQGSALCSEIAKANSEADSNFFLENVPEGSSLYRALYGRSLMSGWEVAVDTQKGKHLILRAAAELNPYAQFFLCEEWLNTDLSSAMPVNCQLAFSELQQPIYQQGPHYPLTQYALGHYYKYGVIVEKNLDLAKSHFKKSFDANYTPAVLPLAYIELEANNLIKATYYLEVAANYDLSEAQLLLGLFSQYYYEKPHYTMVLHWYLAAASQNKTEAFLQLAKMHYLGLGVEQDYKLALDWYLKAAANDDRYAYWNLGMIYLKGQGVDKDLVRAKKYLLLAKDFPEAEYLHEYRIQATPEERQRLNSIGVSLKNTVKSAK